MASWPSSLPDLPLGRQYTEQPPDRRIRTPMDKGPAKQRLLVTANVRPVDVAFRLHQDDVATFDTFYQDNEAITWTWVNPRTNVAATLRFASVPAYNHFGGEYYDVTFRIEVMPS